MSQRCYMQSKRTGGKFTWITLKLESKASQLRGRKALYLVEDLCSTICVNERGMRYEALNRICWTSGLHSHVLWASLLYGHCIRLNLYSRLPGSPPTSGKPD